MLPNDVLTKFNDEISLLQFGKASLSVIKRGSHTHYEIERSYTIQNEEIKNKDEKNTKIKAKS